MRRAEFTALADHVFGPVLAAAYARELVIPALGGRSAAQAIAEGEDVRRAWTALCDAMDVPESRRWEIPPGQRHAR